MLRCIMLQEEANKAGEEGKQLAEDMRGIFSEMEGKRPRVNVSVRYNNITS